jgi:flagellar motor switch protein FliG
MGALGDIPSRMRNAVVAEFHQAACSGAIAEVTARGQAIHGDAEAAPFAWLAQTPSDEILAAIRDEHPQMVALVLAHLEPQKAAELLAVLPGVRQIEVVNRVARIGQTSREVIREVERSLRARLEDLTAGAESTLGAVLDRAEQGVGPGDEQCDADDSAICDWSLDDLLGIDDPAVQMLLREIDDESLCMALQAASEAVRQKFFRNMADWEAGALQSDLQMAGPVHLGDVEEARRRIMRVVQRLEAAGEIVLESHRIGDCEP